MRSTVFITAAAFSAVMLSPVLAPAANAAPTGPVDGPTEIHVRWNWKMKPSIVDNNGDDIPDKRMKTVPGYAPAGNARYGPLPDNGRYKVTLNASRSSGVGRLKCTWRIDLGSKTEKRANRKCAQPLTIKLPEGRFPLSLRVKDRNGVKKVNSHITVKNILMSIMGDSYASGEGFPPFTKTVDGKKVIAWDEPDCQRSRWSGFVRAATMLEKSSKRTNVTLIDVACAGAELEQNPDNPNVSSSGGLLTPQEAIDPADPGKFFPPQVDQLRKIAGKRAWDVSLMSIGGNDVGLSPVVKTCLFKDVLGKGNCYNSPIYGTGPAILWEAVDQNLQDLEDHFPQLAPCLSAKGGKKHCKTQKLANGKPSGEWTKSKPVVITDMKNLVHAMYPDLTHQPAAGGGTQLCDVGSPPQSPLNPIDNAWAFGALYTGKAGVPVELPTKAQYPQYPAADPNPITPTVDGLVPMFKANKKQYGWRIGMEMYKNSRPHGACSPTRWIFGITDAATQPISNLYGVMHPNDNGQAAYADMLGPLAIKIAG